MPEMLIVSRIRIDGGTQPRAALNTEVIAEYAEAMANQVHFPPVVVFYDGAEYWLADGFHRYFAAQKYGKPFIEAEIRQGTLQEAQWYSYSVNQSHGLRRTNEDKRRAVEAALRHPYAGRYSDNEIARHVGVDHKTVAVYRKPILGNSQDTADRTVTRNGSTYTMNTANIGRREVEAPKPMWEVAPEIVAEPCPPATEQSLSQPKAQPVAQSMAVHYSSESPEWYTPKHILDCVIETLGAIDLDPCSNSHENPNVPALVHFTQEDDGLSLAWLGRVYMNPPYGREIVDWIERLVSEYRRGNVTEAVALVPSRTDTEWFRQLREFQRCFIWGRLRFSNGDNTAPFPSVAVYLGNNVQQFVTAFQTVGDIYELVRV